MTKRSPLRVSIGLLLLVIGGVALNLTLAANGVSQRMATLIASGLFGAIATWFWDSDLSRR